MIWFLVLFVLLFVSIIIDLIWGHISPKSYKKYGIEYQRQSLREKSARAAASRMVVNLSDDQKKALKELLY